MLPRPRRLRPRIVPDLFLGGAARDLVQWGPLLPVFVWPIAVPLAQAGVCQTRAASSGAGRSTLAALGLLPLPATAAVRFDVVAVENPQLGLAPNALRAVLPVGLVIAIDSPPSASIWRAAGARRRIRAGP